MTDPARGPTTEELRARVLAQLEDEDRSHEERVLLAKAEVLRATPPAEGRTFYDPARPPLDSEGAERQ